MKDKLNVRFGHTPPELAQDFAEHLKYSQDADIYHTTQEDRYTALALTIRDRIVHQWNLSRKTQKNEKAKRINYLSLEFLMGRAMTNNVINLGIEDELREALTSLGYTYEELADIEHMQDWKRRVGRRPLLPRLICTLELSCLRHGIRYKIGIFPSRSKRWQVEQPDNWLDTATPGKERHDVPSLYLGGEVSLSAKKARAPSSG